MIERPILFSAPMVRALLDGSKTQTRRPVAFPRNRESFVLEDHGNGWWPYQSDDGETSLCDDGMEHRYTCPYGQPGDRLWVRETLKGEFDARQLIERYVYAADGTQIPRCPDLLPQFSDEMAFAHLARRGGVPSIHMPRWASRITLEVTGVRVERLQDISEADAVAEGCAPARLDDDDARHMYTARWAYEILWEQINGPGSWAANPWVWVIEFRRIKP